MGTKYIDFLKEVEKLAKESGFRVARFDYGVKERTLEPSLSMEFKITKGDK
ncbi:hypothetical protein ABES13_05055 [Bacillus pseudomycoides]|uniref:hypothetical protein n=1 Tax=Bacillus pseudomycoides TaxID=64104 RepID=UPI003D2406D4